MTRTEKFWTGKVLLWTIYLQWTWIIGYIDAKYRPELESRFDMLTNIIKENGYIVEYNRGDDYLIIKWRDE